MVKKIVFFEESTLDDPDPGENALDIAVNAWFVANPGADNVEITIHHTSNEVSGGTVCISYDTKE